MFGLNNNNRIKSVIGNISNRVKKTISNWTSGQFHIPGNFNYCGPKTILDENKPALGPVDSACKAHDYAYDEITKNKKTLKNNELIDQVRAADENLINEIGSLPNSGGFAGKVVSGAIKTKRFLQDKGVLNQDLFI
jgi:hypothetical protein